MSTTLTAAALGPMGYCGGDPVWIGYCMDPIQHARLKRDWSASYLVPRIGVHIQTIYDWESGGFPKLPRLRQLAELCGTEYLDLASDLLTRWASSLASTCTLGCQ